MEVIPFKTKPASTPKPSSWTPEAATRQVLEKIIGGEINPSTLIIAWTAPEEGGRSHEYVCANTEGLSAAIGLLEITKVRMTKVL